MLLEDGGDPHDVAARILAAFTQPASVGRHRVPMSTSIGIAQLDPGEATPTPEALLQRADHAMYQAKHAGKSAAATWTDPPTSVHYTSR